SRDCAPRMLLLLIHSIVPVNEKTIGLCMTGPRPKQVIFEHLAEIARALGHANRLELLEALAQGQHAVEALAGQTGLSFANTSRHLQILRRARLVETERRGKQVLYRLAGDAAV